MNYFERRVIFSFLLYILSLFRADSSGNLAQIGLIYQILGKGFLTLKLFRTQIVTFLSIENLAVFYYVEKTCPGGQKCIRLKIQFEEN
jgi:hypothetical protein